MKKQLLLMTFTVLSFCVLSQFSRSIYTSDSYSGRQAIILERNAQTEIVSTRASHGDTLIVTLISIDEFGNTSNYRQSEFSPVNLAGLQLSGAGVNSAGLVTLCFLGASGPQGFVRYITVDPITGASSNFHELAGSYRKGFTRTRTKGDSLISYLAVTGNGIQRVATSMTNTSGNSITVADASITSYPMNGQYDRPIELFIDGTDEYVGIANNLIKSDGFGTFAVLPLSTLGFSSANFVKNQQGEIVVFRANTYTTISPFLSITSSGTYTGGNTVGLGAEEIYTLENGGYRIWNNGNQSKKMIDLDANFNVVAEQNSDNVPLHSAKINGKIYVIGSRLFYPSEVGVGGQSFTFTPQSISVVSDDLTSPVQPFIEYDQELTHHKLRFHTDHCGLSMHDLTGTFGLSYQLDADPRGLAYATKLNIAAKTTTGDTVSSYGSYTSKAIPGPYTNGLEYDFEQMDKYNRGYYVTKAMIEAHISGIGLNDPTYVIPFAIREWPAHGDISKGQAANLAGFIDLDGNNTYNPENGDYPAIYGDACLLNIFHDSPNVDRSSEIETHQYYFMFDCPGDDDLENTIFMRTDNFSRNQDLIDLYAGNYTDIDIGNYSDDYAGSNVELGIIYGYNGDAYDENSGGNLGFEDKLPAMGLMTLQGVKLNNTGVDRPFGIGAGESINGIGFGDGIPDNEYLTLESSVETSNGFANTDMYQLMTGTLANGMPQTANGIEVRHFFYGESDPLFYTSNGIDHGNNYYAFSSASIPYDQRILGSSGPIDLAQQDTLILYSAYVLAIDSTNGVIDSSLVQLFDRSAIIRDMFRNNTTTCGTSFGAYVSESSLGLNEPKFPAFVLYPNPADGSFRVKGLTGEATVRIFDLNGRMVSEELNFADGQELSISALDDAVYLVAIEDDLVKQIIRLVKR